MTVEEKIAGILAKLHACYEELEEMGDQVKEFRNNPLNSSSIPWRSLVTGSRAYGKPKKDSDIDLVVMVSHEDLEKLRRIAPKTTIDRHAASDGDGSISSGSFVFGKLNLIAVTSQHDFLIWRDGTEFLKKKAPVSRDKATKYFRKKRNKG